MRLIYDPWTTRLDPATNTATRVPFANNIIPASRIDPTARRFLADIWKPNGAGDNITGANNYRYTFPQKFEYWNLSDRVDWVLSDKWSIFGRGSRFHTVQATRISPGRRPSSWPGATATRSSFRETPYGP